MQKKHSLAFFFLLASAFVILTSTAIAQEIANEKQSPKTKTDIDILQTYKEISALSSVSDMSERRAAFIKLSAQEKSDLFKFHLAMQLVKRPDLTKEQKDIISEGISMLSPESYGDDIGKRSIAQQQVASLTQKASAFFLKREIFEIFANLGGDESAVQLLEKYQQVIAPTYNIERKKAFSKFSAQERSNIMRFHLAFQMAKRSLNKEQLAFISEVISFVSPENYADTKGTQIKEKLILFNKQASNFFSKDDVFAIFVSFGGERKIADSETKGAQPNETLSSSSKSEWRIEPFNLFNKWGGNFSRTSFLKNTTNQTQDCECSTIPDQDYCSWWYDSSFVCKIAYCKEVPSYCGFLLSWTCTGMCRAQN